MRSWKKRFAWVAALLLVGVVAILGETETRLKKTRLAFRPPRLTDILKLKSMEMIKDDPYDTKKKKLRTELIAAGNKFIVQVPNPPIVLDHALEYWPYHRVYVTSFLGIVTYIKKLFKIGYKILWIFIDMFILLVKIVLQVTEIGKLRHSYDELSRPHPFSTHDDDDY